MGQEKPQLNAQESPQARSERYVQDMVATASRMTETFDALTNRSDIKPLLSSLLGITGENQEQEVEQRLIAAREDIRLPDNLQQVSNAVIGFLSTFKDIAPAKANLYANHAIDRYLYYSEGYRQLLTEKMPEAAQKSKEKRDRTKWEKLAQDLGTNLGDQPLRFSELQQRVLQQLAEFYHSSSGQPDLFLSPQTSQTLDALVAARKALDTKEHPPRVAELPSAQPVLKLMRVPEGEQLQSPAEDALNGTHEPTNPTPVAVGVGTDTMAGVLIPEPTREESGAELAEAEVAAPIVGEISASDEKRRGREKPVYDYDFTPSEKNGYRAEQNPLTNSDALRLAVGLVDDLAQNQSADMVLLAGHLNLFGTTGERVQQVKDQLTRRKKEKSKQTVHDDVRIPQHVNSMLKVALTALTHLNPDATIPTASLDGSVAQQYQNTVDAAQQIFKALDFAITHTPDGKRRKYADRKAIRKRLKQDYFASMRADGATITVPENHWSYAELRNHAMDELAITNPYTLPILEQGQRLRKEADVRPEPLKALMTTASRILDTHADFRKLPRSTRQHVADLAGKTLSDVMEELRLIDRDVAFNSLTTTPVTSAEITQYFSPDALQTPQAKPDQSLVDLYREQSQYVESLLQRALKVRGTNAPMRREAYRVIDQAANRSDGRILLNQRTSAIIGKAKRDVHFGTNVTNVAASVETYMQAQSTPENQNLTDAYSAAANVVTTPNKYLRGAIVKGQAPLIREGNNVSVHMAPSVDVLATAKAFMTDPTLQAKLQEVRAAHTDNPLNIYVTVDHGKPTFTFDAHYSETTSPISNPSRTRRTLAHAPAANQGL